MATISTGFWMSSKVEAEFRRDVRDLFTTHLNGSLSCSFVRGWFRSEEQTISAEKYYKGRVVKGNNLNLHFHNILLMSCVPEEIQDEFQLSCYFYMKWFRCYRQACKQRGIKPKPLKPPYRDDNGVIRGSVVFLFKRSLTDDQGNDSLASYVIKKAAWGLSAEATAKSRKNESKGLNMQSIVESKRATCFKANAVKMLVVVNHGQREYEYSKMKEGPVHKPKKTKKPRKTPEEMMHISLKKYENGGAANLKVRASACKKKNTKPISKKSDESKKCKKGLGNRYINKKSNQEKENERRRWRPYAAVNHSEYYKVGEADLIKDDVERLFEEFVKESSEAREKGRKKRKNKVKFEKGETILAS
ncbi:MAG TPA: hypothetical protein VFO10_06530 [Oligoflexus sp.]|uniref:hypothetical protein n=1 Tax=Oligoflexus sp. TaxID=1971216 RepID=UPI002D7F0142|nr:hypothetical protein [Oligoflexus sp.]HET9236887.1 hypothetical protein [Oligoflexus sp.]